MEPIYFTRGAAYFNLKQYPAAVTAIKDYLARYPKGTRVNEATFSLAQASFFAKDYAAAARGFATLENVPALPRAGAPARRAGRQGGQRQQ